MLALVPLHAPLAYVLVRLCGLLVATGLARPTWVAGGLTALLCVAVPAARQPSGPRHTDTFAASNEMAMRPA